MAVDSISGLSRTAGTYNAVFTDKTDNATLDQTDFLNLMVAQMQNQDFMNPMDDTQMVTQMVQFSNMQQMQEMASYSRSNYAMSLVGKTVTASRFNVSGDLDSTTGPVQRISLVDDEYVIYVGGKKYTMAQIMDVSASASESISMVAPENYPLTTRDVTSDSAVVGWEAPTEDESVTQELRYSVYYGTQGPFDTLERVEAGTAAGPENQKGAVSRQITGLEPRSDYYINVVVTDPNGVRAVYKPARIRTRAEE